MNKKSTVAILCCYLLTMGLGVSVYGQDKNVNQPHRAKHSRVQDKSQSAKAQEKKSVGYDLENLFVIMMNDNAYVPIDGKIYKVGDDEMVNRMRVSSSGLITKMDGSEVRLKNGEALSTDGKVVKIDQNQLMKAQLMQANYYNQSLDVSNVELENKMEKLNEKIQLLMVKADYLNEKTKMMEEYLDQSRKLSKDQKQKHHQQIKHMNEEIYKIDAKLKEIEEIPQMETSSVEN